MPIYRGVVCGGFAAADTSYVIVRASFSPIRHSKQPFSFYWRPKSLARTREAYSGIGILVAVVAVTTQGAHAVEEVTGRVEITMPTGTMIQFRFLIARLSLALRSTSHNCVI